MKNMRKAGVTNSGNTAPDPSATGTVTVHVRRWVRWWIYVGVVCGAIALANIFWRHLTHRQEEVILFLGVLHWILGGLVCWAWDGIQFEKAAGPQEGHEAAHVAEERQKPLPDFHSRSSTRLRKRGSERLRLLNEYLRRWEKEHSAS